MHNNSNNKDSKPKWWQFFIREIKIEVDRPIEKVVQVYKQPPMENPPSSGEMREWRDRRECEFFIQGLKAEYEDIKEDVINGAYTTETTDGTAQQLAKAIGRCEQLLDVIETLDEFKTRGEEE